MREMIGNSSSPGLGPELVSVFLNDATEAVTEPEISEESTTAGADDADDEMSEFLLFLDSTICLGSLPSVDT